MGKRVPTKKTKATRTSRSGPRNSSAPVRTATGRSLLHRNRAEHVIPARWRPLAFATTHAWEESLQQALDEAGELTGSPVGFYHFVERDAQAFSLPAWSTRRKPEFCKVEGQGLHYSLHRAGVWNHCARKRRAVIHNDDASLPHRKGLPAGHARLVRELVVPGFREDRIVAILGVGNKPGPDIRQEAELATFVEQSCQRTL